MSSRPMVTVDGVAPALLARELVGLVLHERRRHPGRLRLRVALSSDLLRDPRQGPGLRLGALVGATFEPDDAAWGFEGTVRAINVRRPQDGGPVVLVDVEDGLGRLRTGPRTRTWHDVGETDLVSRIAAEHGLGAQVDDLPGVHRFVRQEAVSDLAFLQTRAEAVGHDLWVHGQTLHQGPPGRRSSAHLGLRFGQELVTASVRTSHADGDDDAPRTHVTGETVATPAPVVGCTVSVTGVAPWVDERVHRVTAARHTYDSQGLRTRFRASAD
ncbi:hypothetical protein [Ornithinimicrobium sp. W1665]|uniref:hypothetical protein n=1 Tax=Ornithinimicrobium sp. W1665 TaxID=3416666 RepID=UPI003CF122D6